jgi:hypothetical protein
MQVAGMKPIKKAKQIELGKKTNNYIAAGEKSEEMLREKCRHKKIAENEEISLPTAYKIINQLSDGKKDEDIASNILGRR